MPAIALAEEDELRRLAVDGVPERRAGAALEERLRLVALPGQAEPDRRTERCPSGIRSTACATARSCATTTPARPPSTTEAPAAIPSTTRTTGALRRPSRARTSRSG